VSTSKKSLSIAVPKRRYRQPYNSLEACCGSYTVGSIIESCYGFNDLICCEGHDGIKICFRNRKQEICSNFTVNKINEFVLLTK